MGLLLMTLCLVMTVGCQQTDGEVGEPVEPEIGGDIPLTPTGCVTAPNASDAGTRGAVYVDEDESDLSEWARGVDPEDTPLSGVFVSILGSGEEQVTQTCDDGTYAFTDLEEGVYMVAPHLGTDRLCTTRNCNSGLSTRIRSGNLKMVTIGDSVPVIGDAPLFPERLKTLMSDLVNVESKNVAVAGSTAIDWRPDGVYYGSRLSPELWDADLLVISLGGNDLLYGLNDPALLDDLDAAVDAAFVLVVQIVERVLEIVDAVHAVRPDLDVLYCLYPNYGQATSTSPWDLVNLMVGADTLVELLTLTRESIPHRQHLMVADLFGAFEGLPLDDMLLDELHFNDLGQTRYAEAIFESLGGVLIGPSPLRDRHGQHPLGQDHGFGLVP
ncbi:MAG: GDSL-type esterase/lipase family protein [Myxococcota bacterium]|nr:GDSL-type esterase/lipase family protein [Myxococcota bacterium]